jgi:hypothetical protein
LPLLRSHRPRPLGKGPGARDPWDLRAGARRSSIRFKTPRVSLARCGMSAARSCPAVQTRSRMSRSRRGAHKRPASGVRRTGAALENRHSAEHSQPQLADSVTASAAAGSAVRRHARGLWARILSGRRRKGFRHPRGRIEADPGSDNRAKPASPTHHQDCSRSRRVEKHAPTSENPPPRAVPAWLRSLSIRRAPGSPLGSCARGDQPRAPLARH